MENTALEYYIDSTFGNISDWFEANLNNSIYYRTVQVRDDLYEISIDWGSTKIASNKIQLDIVGDTFIKFISSPKGVSHLRILVKCSVTNATTDDFEISWEEDIRWANGLACHFVPNISFLVELIYDGSNYYGTFVKLSS
jgi:hypothetical protein